jgi:transposase
MIEKRDRKQKTLLIPGSIDDFIPDDHILKQVDRVLDLSWLRNEVRGCYREDFGRPGIDPESAVRLMLAGYFHGIVHDRKLMREAQVNLAFRWFAGYKLHEKLPDHSSLTRIRQRWGKERFRKIFLRTIKSCMDAGIVDGQTVHADATLIRADVSWESLAIEYVDNSLRENSAREESAGDDEDKKGPGRSSKKKKRAKKRSKTDPDASMATSNKNSRLEPTYKQHTAVDDKTGVIVDVEVTTGEINEGKKLIETIERVEDTTGVKVKHVTADAAYAHPLNYKMLEERRIQAVIPPQKPGASKNPMPISMFKYDEKKDLVRCPAGKVMRRKTRMANGWVYRCSASDCKGCRHYESCVPKSGKSRTVLIVDGHHSLMRARRKWGLWPKLWKRLYRRHRTMVEGVHGEEKTQHGLRRAVRRGLDNVSIQVYLAAAVVNLKRLAAFFRPFLLLVLIISVVMSTFRKALRIFKEFSNGIAVKYETGCNAT